MAQAAELSGIVSIVFCGITMARYALPNLTDNGLKLMNRLYHTLSHTFENSAFLFIGIGFVAIDLPWKQMGPGLFAFAFLALHSARYCNIKVISYLVNKPRK